MAAGSELQNPDYGHRNQNERRQLNENVGMNEVLHHSRIDNKQGEQYPARDALTLMNLPESRAQE